MIVIGVGVVVISTFSLLVLNDAGPTGDTKDEEEGITRSGL